MKMSRILHNICKYVCLSLMYTVNRNKLVNHSKHAASEEINAHKFSYHNKDWLINVI